MTIFLLWLIFILFGALGAELIGAFKTLIENPVMMVV